MYFYFFHQVKWEKTGKVKAHKNGADGDVLELQGLGVCCQQCFLSAKQTKKEDTRHEMYSHCWFKEREKNFDVVCQRVARLPDIVPTLLELGDDCLLNVPLVRRVLSSSESVGPWLLDRINNHNANHNLSAALTFLETVSKSDEDAEQIENLAVPWANVSMRSYNAAGASRANAAQKWMPFELSCMRRSQESLIKSAGIDFRNVFSVPEGDLDWIQIGDVGYEPGSRYSEAHPKTPIPWIAEGPGAILWIPLSDDLTNGAKPSGDAAAASTLNRWEYWQELTLQRQNWKWLSMSERKTLWKRAVSKVNGRLLTVSQAKDVLRCGPLKPETCTWAPVMLDEKVQEHYEELENSETNSDFQNSLVQMSPLRASIVSSALSAYPPASESILSDEDTVSFGYRSEWKWPHFSSLKDETLPWRAVVSNNGVLLNLSEAKCILQHAPLVHGEDLWAPVLRSDLSTPEVLRAGTKAFSALMTNLFENKSSSACNKLNSIFRSALGCCYSLPLAQQAQNIESSSPEPQPKTALHKQVSSPSKGFDEVVGGGPSEYAEFETSRSVDGGKTIDYSDGGPSVRINRELIDLMLNVSLVEDEMLDWVQCGDLNFAPGTSWRSTYADKHPSSEKRLLPKPDIALFKPIAKNENSNRLVGGLVEAILDVKDAELRKKVSLIFTHFSFALVKRLEMLVPVRNTSFFFS